MKQYDIFSVVLLPTSLHGLNEGLVPPRWACGAQGFGWALTSAGFNSRCAGWHLLRRALLFSWGSAAQRSGYREPRDPAADAPTHRAQGLCGHALQVYGAQKGSGRLESQLHRCFSTHIHLCIRFYICFCIHVLSQVSQVFVHVHC